MTTRVTLGPRRNVTIGDTAIYAGGGLVRPNTRFVARLAATGNAGITADGTLNSPNGTASNIAVSTTLAYAMTDYASAATLNATALVSTGAQFRWDRRLLFQGLAGLGTSIAVVRAFIGMSNQAWSTLLAGGDSPGTVTYSGACFRYSTAAGDTTWKCLTFNGATQTVMDSGVAVVASTPAKFEISDDGTTTTFKIAGNIVASTTATRPASTTIMRVGAGVVTLEAVAKSIQVGWLFTETD